MAFDNHLGKGKDWRKPYYNSSNFDWSCRNHGSCGWCESRRTFKNLRRMPADTAPRKNNRNPVQRWNFNALRSMYPDYVLPCKQWKQVQFLTRAPNNAGEANTDKHRLGKAGIDGSNPSCGTNNATLANVVIALG